MSDSQMSNSFQEMVKESELPVLADFWADWCGPCRMLGPVIKQIAEEYKGKLKVVKVNVDEKPQVAGAYQIQGIPTVILFKNGEIAHRMVGALPLDRLKAEIDQHL